MRDVCRKILVPGDGLVKKPFIAFCKMKNSQRDVREVASSNFGKFTIPKEFVFLGKVLTFMVCPYGDLFLKTKWLQ